LKRQEKGENISSPIHLTIEAIVATAFAAIWAISPFAAWTKLATTHRTLTALAARWTIALFSARPVDYESFALKWLALKCFLRFSSFVRGIVANERKSSGTSRKSVHNDFDFGDFAVTIEKLTNLIF